MSKREKIEHPIVARIRHETDVVAESRDEDDRAFFRARSCRPKRKLTRPSGDVCRALRLHPVLAQDFNRHAGERLPVLIESDEDIAARDRRSSSPAGRGR